MGVNETSSSCPDFAAWLATRPAEAPPGCVLANGSVVDGWRVEAYLGSGLSAEVYRVRNVALGYDGALKLLVNGGAGLAARFAAEADAIRFLALPALPRFLGAGEFRGRAYFVMEHLLPLPEQMPRGDVPRFMNKVAKAVQSLHDSGFVHRDLKPGNIMIRPNGDPVLIDLGLVKKRGDGKTPLGGNPLGVSVLDGRPVGVGTLDFAAPEQLLKGEALVQGDVFSLGRIAWHLYGGNPPGSMRKIIHCATRDRPEERYPTANAFAAAIRRRFRVRAAVVFSAALMAAFAAVAFAHRGEIKEAIAARLSPRRQEMAHVQRPDEADVAYLARMKRLAEGGDMLAQIAVAEAFFHGKGTPTNRAEAVLWYRLAAEAGEADAQASLGLCLLRGHGCDRNPAEAVRWYSRAAEQGNLGGMNDLAFCYLNGFGVERDEKKGFEIAMKAALRGHAASQTMVGECYLDGRGTGRDVERAETWLYRAARQDNRRAQELLRSR